MECVKVEFAAVESVVLNSVQPNLKDLSDLELALVGGGCGDISLG